MPKSTCLLAVSCLLVVLVGPGHTVCAQDASSQAGGFRSEFLNHFANSTRKTLSLAEAIPAEKYSWRPGPGVMSVAEVLSHVAEADLHYLAESLDRKWPADLDARAIGKLREKDQIVAALRKTFDFVRSTVEQMPDSDMDKTTKLYGRSSSYRNVLMQLLQHSNEHVGQSIAYARMNGIAPPWSR